MERSVDNARSQLPRHRQSTVRVEDSLEGMEPGMQVPSTVLDECGDSFKAADEKREKASTQFFSDTGLMAMLCRHDRVLWLVNMTSAGERQHYSLALLQRLIDNLPPNMSIGNLYDIACQLHRSCVKWGFLQEHLHRITFGTAVFHAYAHNWACQLIYHPRKRTGFGLSDGEGCERLWSDLKPLIPTMRVSGVCA
jgi:Kyakuja-Dileera-Zisupton transposase